MGMGEYGGGELTPGDGKRKRTGRNRNKENEYKKGTIIFYLPVQRRAPQLLHYKVIDGHIIVTDVQQTQTPFILDGVVMTTQA